MEIFGNGIQEEIDHPPLPRMDVDCDRHPRAHAPFASLDPERSLQGLRVQTIIEGRRRERSRVQMGFGRGRGRRGTGGLRILAGRGRGDRIGGRGRGTDPSHDPGDHAVLLEGVACDLDLGLVADMDKSDVAARDIRCDGERLCWRFDGGERLAGLDDGPDTRDLQALKGAG